jgi:hypothetical protein
MQITQEWLSAKGAKEEKYLSHQGTKAPRIQIQKI